MAKTKKELVADANKALLDLFKDEAKGGYAEYPQFCEEFLRENLRFYSKEGLEKLIEDTNDARHFPVGEETEE